MADPLREIFATVPEPKIIVKVEENPEKDHFLGLTIKVEPSTKSLNTSERIEQRWLSYCDKYKDVFRQWATKKLVWMPVGAQHPLTARYRCPKSVLTRKERAIQDRLDYFVKREFVILSQQKESFTPPCNHVLDRPPTMFDEFFSPQKHISSGACGIHWHQ